MHLLAALLALAAVPTAFGQASPTEPAVLLAAGDIASCASSGDEATAQILDETPGTIATLGDNAYPDGSPAQFAACYGPTWGRHKARTRPSVGNHEYNTPGAAGYFAYFGAVAGDPAAGYYSYDLGAWHIVVLNSMCWLVGGCGRGAPQERWLRADLAGNPRSCTLAYWHHARFSSARLVQLAWMEAAWKALYENGADVVLSGHDHVYERHRPQTPSGDPSAAYGIREFVVGTGGFSHNRILAPLPTSQVANDTTFGVLELRLGSGGYEWTFLPEPGASFTDTGSGTCHGPPPDTTSPAATLTAPTHVGPFRGDLTLAAEASDDVGLKRVEFLVDGVVVARDSTRPYTTTWDTTTIGDGLRTVWARAVDASGNPTNSAGRAIVIDNAIPDTSIVARPAVDARLTTATFRFRSEPGATFECSLDGTLFRLCRSPQRYERLSEGRHLFAVRALDAAGNYDPTPAEWRWRIDLTRPHARLTLARMARGPAGTAQFTFRSSERGATFQCSLDGGPWEQCASPAVYAALALGRHEFRARAVDAARNISWPPLRQAWSISRFATGELVVASAGDDIVVGTPGNDIIRTLAGDDVVRAGGGNDVVDGDLGNDFLAGELGSDRLAGGPGADRLVGQLGADRLAGGPGADRLVGGVGHDVLLGRAGRDRLDALDRLRDVVDGGPGRDTARVDRRLDRVRAIELVRRHRVRNR
ncbi:MAG: Ig-like domain-containing protein [Actinomycetota bacterium]|nr:Ig-like domain-containing protein [Actinomycetota bacterium]